MTTHQQVADYLGVSIRTFRRYSPERRERLTKDCESGINQQTADLVAHLHREVYKHNEITKRYAFVSMLTGAFSLVIDGVTHFDLAPLNQRNLALAIKKVRGFTYA